MNLKEQIGRLPQEPGVYIFYHPSGKVLYVGKSKSLRSRVRSYLNPSQDSRPLIQNLAQDASRVEVIVTDTEKEALILENSLINKFKPPCNIIFRDDTTYGTIKIDLSHDFPRVLVVRKIKKDGALYFGPYPSGQALKETMRVIKRHFQLRTCTDSEFNRRKRPCLLYQIHRCGGACTGEQTEEEYRKVLDNLILFLQGKDQSLLKALGEKMGRASGELNFEKAAVYRDKISALKKTMEKQKVLSTDQRDRDIFAVVQQGEWTVIQVLYIRSGKLISSKAELLSSCDSTREILRAYLQHYYCKEVYLPHEILLGEEVDDLDLLGEFLREKKGKKIPLLVPKRGRKMEWIRLAKKNGHFNLMALRKKRLFSLDLLGRLQDILGLASLPYRMECFDISNIQGAYAVGSMAVFELAEPAKGEYRKYKIRTVSGPDDFAMMEEVLFRRFRKGVLEGELPDLVVIDGGKGQLGVAKKVMEQLGISHLPVIGLAKGRQNKDLPERIFLDDRGDPLSLSETDPAFQLIQRLRDEAHRFAITYHRTLRKKETMRKK